MNQKETNLKHINKKFFKQLINKSKLKIKPETKQFLPSQNCNLKNYDNDRYRRTDCPTYIVLLDFL